MTTSSGLASFDLSPFASGTALLTHEASAIAAGIDDTLRSTGFLLVSGHGIDDGVRAAYFAAMREFFALHLRLIHYPPMDRLTPEPGQLGCGAHTDYGTVTLLADDGVGGLQVRQRSGEWIDVTVPTDHLVVNLGDLMAIWTNDRWVSNPHRVVNPPGVDRYSSPLFVTPPFHLRIETLPTCLADGETLRHEPLVSGPYLLSRFDGTHSYRNVDGWSAPHR